MILLVRLSIKDQPDKPQQEAAPALRLGREGSRKSGPIKRFEAIASLICKLQPMVGPSHRLEPW
ncbi:hypothetical protein EFB08_13585 [Rufibacter latericius]|uniref:Uncharacterized protein n=1 Tax=Rufibacter latericius TaxID=2487040 RepID=A0A3M9MJZ4_9BACT|nr:hypothetical protein EFB08_13585 [Rufibacter latericius]